MFIAIIQHPIDSHDMVEFDSKWLRQQIGVINQEPVLLSGSISDNISFGKRDATRLQIVKAAKQANAHEFISHLEVSTIRLCHIAI